MAIFHTFFDPEVLVGGNPDIVLPDDWNADHASPPWVVMDWREATNPGHTWVDMPAALQPFFNDNRTYMYADLRKAVDARLIVDIMTAGASGAEIRAQYSLNNGGSWAYLAAGSGPKQSIAAAGIFSSSWATVDAAAKVETVLLRYVGINGNGVLDPKFVSITLQVR